MKVLVEAHRYELENFEDKEGNGQELQFIQKEDKGDGNGFVTVSDGTTNEEVLEVLIDRLTGLNSKFPCKENAVAITHIETALLWLNKRTSDRMKRGVEGKNIK